MTNSLVISDINPQSARQILQLALVFQDGIPPEKTAWWDAVETLHVLLETMEIQLPEGKQDHEKKYYDAVAKVLRECCELVVSLS